MRLVAMLVLAWCGCHYVRSAHAETMAGALSRAYYGNPDLNRYRATVRAQDEEVPKAAAGMRPKVGVTANGAGQFSRFRRPTGVDVFGRRIFFDDQFFGTPKGATFSASQTLFDGGRTRNSVLQAESGVFAARAQMRLAEQATLQHGAVAFMNVLRDTAIVRLRTSNVLVLQQQLEQTKVRLEYSEVTATDVAQAEAALAVANSELYAARASLKISAANYRQIVGVAPKSLDPARAIENLLPKPLDTAIRIALVEHPGVASATHMVDAAELAVKVQEGALLPTVSVGVQVSQQYDSFFGTTGSRQFSAQVGGALNIPIYQGGAEYASIRQAKERLTEARLNADVQRDSVRATVVSSFSLLDTAKASIISGQAAVKAAEVALEGVRNEANVGQRTTLDILNAQQALVNARLRLIISQHDRIVASYAALAATGRLSAEALGLRVSVYDPAAHFEQVRDSWFGIETPSGW